MANIIQRYFYGISIKLFLCLWLIIISSVTLTYGITVMLSDSSSIHSPSKYSRTLLKEARKLIIKNNNKNNIINIVKEQNLFYQKTKHYLILKNIQTNEILLPEGFSSSQAKQYIEENNFINLASIKFSGFKMSGPRLVNVNNQDYQVFVVANHKSHKIRFFLEQFPLWLRIIIAFGISFVLCWLLAKHFSKPLIAIQQAAINFGQGNLSTRLDKETKRHDELGAVALSFNIMAETLENNFHAHQRLLGDVSHELRTPLARLQMAIGLIEMYQKSPEKQLPHINRCEKEVDILDKMLADILTLSRLENAVKNVELLPMNLSTVIDNIIDDCSYVAEQSDITINTFTSDKIMVLADQNLIDSAISNIIYNAIKYSPVDTSITISAKIIDSHVSISVSDQGIGVPEALLTKLFTPFYRVADDRDRKSGGTGLGLAIAMQAIQLHSGKIIAKNNENGGLTVAITLPMIEQ